MKILSACTLLCLGVSLSCIKAQQYNWKLIWSDEFDGTHIDQSKWQHDIGGDGWGNNELEFYTDRAQNSFLENGKLVI